MIQSNKFIRIAILGGGPSGLFMFKRLVEAGRTDINIAVFERKQLLGAGMPYSRDGACDEHITNVSGNEIPELVTTVEEWIKTEDRDTLKRFRINPENFNDYKVLPRLLFGRYLSKQFNLLTQQAKERGIPTTIYYSTDITDIIDAPEIQTVNIVTGNNETFEFDKVIVCTGHNWPKQLEGKIPGYFDSPYPPAKLAFQANHAVAVKGSSLTAIDALRTLARSNGQFTRTQEGKLNFTLNLDSIDFKIIMHSRNGLLPALRFHLEDSHLAKDSILSDEEVDNVRNENEGFLPLDYVYRKNFLDGLQANRPEFYDRIKDLSIEEFVTQMMSLRETVPAFQLLKAEYAEAEKSIDREQSVYWKEMLAILSFAMNYPAKYFSAEDMQRLQKTLMPLISIVIAFAPQGSVEEMLALYDAGVLDIVSVGDDSSIEPQQEGGIIYLYTNEQGDRVSNRFLSFVDCVGQPHLLYNDLPYMSLLSSHTVSPARLRFRDAEKGAREIEHGNKKVIKDHDDAYYLQVAGIAINDNFQVVDAYGALNERIYMMAVPYIGGYNPDYSGLDFGEAASARIIKSLLPSLVQTEI
ncbi:FAD/NAD(P)-binding protein [Mucilaginibacter terrae]|uniref:FAD/NAD(P)-binding protein n=1 Tax=Mucilaginibacter terrae TaxID=1955052 RepID=UPI0036381DC9